MHRVSLWFALAASLALLTLACPPSETGDDAGRSDGAADAGAPAAPQVRIEASATSGLAPLFVEFSPDVTLGRGATVAGYAWDFGDGQRATGQAPSHVFEAVGDYTVTLVVTDSNELSGEASLSIHAAAPPSAEYVGSAQCRGCHQAQHDAWAESGHSHALTLVEGGAPSFPFSQVPAPPDGVAWADVSYVVGGFGWRALFADADGNLITGPDVQYNLATQAFAPHQGDARGTAELSCAACHSTGWQGLADNGGQHQGGLSGVPGTWAEAGVGCEACHGPGSAHVAQPSTQNIVLDTASEQCGTCHSQKERPGRILVRDNLVVSGQQYTEFMRGGNHSTHVWCSFCHDPHASAHYSAQAEGQAMRYPCDECHAASRTQLPEVMADLRCEDCHLPLAAVSAVATGTGMHRQGDLKSHLWGVDPSGADWDTYLDGDGEYSWITDSGANGTWVKLHLAWSCGHCHDGEAAPLKTLSELSAMAHGIHE